MANVTGVSDEELKLSDANDVQPLNALSPMDVRSAKSKLFKPVQPSNALSPIVETLEMFGVVVSVTQLAKLALPIDLTFEKSKLSKAAQFRKAVSLIKHSVSGRDSVVSFSQPSKQE